ncbi:MAG: M24 family metallopeptidase, partial [Bryobacteraceae bacterium]
MRLEEIQRAIQEDGADAWLFFDHHRRDPLAYRVLSLPLALNPSRRWYYLIPAKGHPKKLLNRVEPSTLEALPGEAAYYSAWPEQQAQLCLLLKGHTRIAMQYSRECAVPY